MLYLTKDSSRSLISHLDTMGVAWETITCHPEPAILNTCNNAEDDLILVASVPDPLPVHGLAPRPELVTKLMQECLQ